MAMRACRTRPCLERSGTTTEGITESGDRLTASCRRGVRTNPAAPLKSLALPGAAGPVPLVYLRLGDLEGRRVADEIDVAIHGVKTLRRAQEH